VKIALVVAMTRQGVMGKNNQLPWHLPGDLKRFKQITLGHPIIMGRKTFDSIGKALPNRTNIVVTRDPAKLPPTVLGATSLDEALNLAREALRSQPPSERDDEIYVIGGAEVFRTTLARADKLYLTWIEPPFEGDVIFPDLKIQEWRCTFEERVEEPFAYVFADYERVR
jgi:dihydrofolate reductase